MPYPVKKEKGVSRTKKARKERGRPSPQKDCEEGNHYMPQQELPQVKTHSLFFVSDNKKKSARGKVLSDGGRTTLKPTGKYILSDMMVTFYSPKIRIKKWRIHQVKPGPNEPK